MGSEGADLTLLLFWFPAPFKTFNSHLPFLLDSAEKVKPGDLGKLGRLTSSNITDRSLQLSWTVEKDFDTFLIHYRADGSKDVQKLKLSRSLRSSIITGLRPNTKYTIYLYGVSFGQRTKPITTIVTTADKKAVKLGNLSTSNITANSLRLSWTVDRPFDSFLIQYRVQGSEETHNITVTGGRRSHLIVGLKPTTRYTVYIYGISAGLRTEPLTTDITTRAEERPQQSKVSDFSVTNITADSLQLSWVTEKEYDSFFVEYGVKEDRDMLSFTATGDRRSSIITGLRPTTTYTFYLYGVSAGQRTKPLTAVATTTDKDVTKLKKLGHLSVSNVTTNSFQLSWVAEADFDSFVIQYRVPGSKVARKRTVTGNRRQSVITGLRPTTSYRVLLFGVSQGQRMRPLTALVSTRASTDKSGIKPSRINKVGTLSVSNITTESFQLSWATDRVFDSFLVQYKQPGLHNVQNLTVDGSRRTTTITGLRPTAKYTLNLYGLASGQRTKPLTTTVTTKAFTDTDKAKPTKVIKLENLSVSNVTEDSFQLSWGAEKNFDSFVIQYGVRGSGDVQNLTVTGDRRLSLITGLRPTTVYTVTIYGISGGVRTKPLNSVTTTKASTDTDKAKPSKVIKLENLSVSNITADSFRLSWGAEKNFDSFVIQYGVRGSGDVQNLTVTGDHRLSLITGLRPTTVYTVTIYGISGGVRTKPLNTVTTTKDSTDKDKIKPSKVIKLENLSVSNITADSFQLSWGAEKNFDSFVIQYGVRGSGDVQNLTVTGDRRLSLITGLRPTTVYTVTIYGISGGVRTKPLNIVTTTKGKPSEVIKLLASNVTADSVRLSWSPQKDIDFFIIQYRVRGSAVRHNVTVMGDRRSFIITGLKPATKYLFSLYSVFREKHIKSLTLTVTTKGRVEPKPSKLGDLSISNVTSDSIPFSWTAEKGFDTFLIRYKVHGLDSVQNFTVTGANRSTTIKGLRPSTKYTVYVHGVYNGKRTKPLSRVVTTK
ncbi:tenascin-X-like, partial [Mustelus asterias]